MIKGGQSFVSSPPAFSNDGKKLLVCTGNTVAVFSTFTGMQIMELEGHTARVTSVIVVPVSGPASKILCYCWTSSLDGTICYWDFSLPELIKKVEIRLPVFSMVIPNAQTPPVESNKKASNLYALVSVEHINKSNDTDNALRGQIRMCNLNKSRLVGGLLAETRNPELIVVSKSGEFFGICNKRKLHVWKIPARDFKYDEVKKIKLHHTKKLTALAFHPTERLVAGGDKTGRILVWRGFGWKKFSLNEPSMSRGRLKNEEEMPGVRGDDDAESCSTWHWHPSEVKFLCFSPDGAYLYSGGKEGVLVVWQLDTGKKKFLPRLGSPLLCYTESLDPSLSSISCADNQIHLLKMPSMEILKSISGIKLPFSFLEVDDGLSSGFVFDNKGLVALRTDNYCVQFYSLFDNREVSQVQVCERNHHPGDDVTVVVTLLALSIDSSQMSTVEVRLPEGGIGGLICLKFWASGSRCGKYALSTIIYEPHSDAGISALAFHPTHGMAVTASYGGDFKIWVCGYGIQQKDQLLQKSGWKCQSVGSYKKKPMTAAAFSPDGSVLAVAAEAIVTLWNPETNVLITIIGETLTPITTLSFIGKSEYLVSVSQGSKPQLSVWDLSKLSVLWTYNLLAEAVTCATDSSHFAVLALLPKSSKQAASDEISLQEKDGIILLFSVEDPVPMATWSARRAKGGGLSFIQANLPSDDEKSVEAKTSSTVLVYMSGGHEYVVFDPYSRGEHKKRTNHWGNGVPLEEPGQFGYASIYGELPDFNPKRDQILDAPFVPSEKPWETIFSGSSHVLPPLSKLCSAFLASLLEKRPAVVE